MDLLQITVLNMQQLADLIDSHTFHEKLNNSTEKVARLHFIDIDNTAHQLR